MKWSVRDKLKGILLVLLAETIRELITARRYLIESISGLAMVYILFMGFFFSGQGFTNTLGMPTQANNSVDVAYRVVGFILWLFALNSVGHFSNAIRDDANIGVLEQIALSPVGLVVDLWGKALGKTIIDVVMIGLVMISIVWTTGVSLSFPVLSVATIFLLTLAGLYGLSFFFAGLALIYKRLGSITIVVRFAFLILTGAITPLEKFPPWLQVICKALPMTEGLKILRNLMVEKLLLSQIPMRDIVVLCLNSAAYLASGLFLFKLFEKIARKKGLLGTY